ncbi:MAG: hypothetical protein M3P34_09675 [Actinomycetota bacterium]|nr:hypothetical protein [Actinomycetota bacterium]
MTHAVPPAAAVPVGRITYPFGRFFSAGGGRGNGGIRRARPVGAAEGAGVPGLAGLVQAFASVDAGTADDGGDSGIAKDDEWVARWRSCWPG